ncbi:MAG: Iron compound ABC transporter, permease protein [Firmicutes bacterium]|nr:Iron compound ABC transporter, permease protein [Bacillota bacterium]MDI6705588.1 iron ABC transporter permease [Bacillota bacterium]
MGRAAVKDIRVEASKTSVRERTVYRLTMMSVLAGLCIASLVLSVSFGALHIPAGEVVKALLSDGDGVNRQVIWNIRLPRTLVAGLVGICLSLSGVILQGIMRNPLASPGIIGVSSGSGLAAVIILIVLPNYYYLVTPFAFLGAFAATILIYLLAWKNGINPMRLILSGVAVSAFLGAGINALMILFPDRVHGVMSFMVGGLAARTWKHFYILWPYTLIGTAAAMVISPKLNVLMLGDEIAISLGVKVERTRMAFIALASLLAASAVSIVGILGFVGLIVPHITRLIIGSDHRYLIPASALSGASLLMACDTVARVIMDPVEIPVGIIMAALGAPFFLYLLRGGIKSDA